MIVRQSMFLLADGPKNNHLSVLEDSKNTGQKSQSV